MERQPPAARSRTSMHPDMQMSECHRQQRPQLPGLHAVLRGLWCNAGGIRGADAAEVAFWHHILYHCQTLQSCKLTRVEWLQCCSILSIATFPWKALT